MTSARTWLARFAVGLVIAAGFSIGVAVSASAHDVLISSDPTGGTTLRAVPSTVSFTFDQPVQNFDPVVSLIGPDGKQYATGTPQISGNVVTGDVAPGPAGAYIAAYRIVSADGHPVTGEVRFTLAVGAARASGVTPASDVTSASGVTPASGTAVVSGTAPASGALSAPAPNSTAAATGSGGLSTGIWIGLIVAALVIAAAMVVLLRRPQSGRPATGPKADKDY